MKYYLAKDILLLPTNFDIWGLVINEAIASGLPVISTNKCMAALELIDPGVNGFINNPEDFTAMANQVKGLCSNQDFYEKACRKSLETISSYSIEQMAKDHLDAFDEILSHVNF